jgi:hypothetical protein
MGGPIIIWPPDVCSDFPGCYQEWQEICLSGGDQNYYCDGGYYCCGPY